MATIQLNHIAKAYAGGPRVIRDVTIDIRDKEFVVLVGPSGCGKSTLLRMIAGLEEITAGDLLLDGERINDLAPNDRDIAMVFQNYALYPHMTVFDNMAFGLKLRKLPKIEIRDRVLAAARILDIEALLDRKPKDMSGGQRQRVAIGRAIVREPRAFLFDEPLSNLDAKLRGQTRIELQKLHRALQATILYVTHDQVEAMTLGDRIVVLRGGDVMQFDTPLALYNQPANRFVAGFIGTPPMNFLPGRLSRRGEQLWFNSTDGAVTGCVDSSPHRASLLTYEGQSITMGIRAEAFAPRPDASAPMILRAVSEAVEHMGNEVLVYLLTGTTRLVARLLPAEAPLVAAGQHVVVALDLSQAHFFDDATDKTIR